MFNNIQNSAEAMNETSDRLGGFQPLPSGIYRATVALAYGSASQGGALSLVVKYNIHREGEKDYPFTQTYWVSTKKGETFYTDKNGNQHNLAGFNHANHLVNLIAGTDLRGAKSENKTVNLYSYEAKKEVPTTVPVLVDLVGGEVALAIKQIKANKQEKVDGTYVDTNDERVYNDVDKIFKIDKGQLYTFDELRNSANPEFALKWKERWEGKVDNQFKPVATTATSSSSNPVTII